MPKPYASATSARAGRVSYSWMTPPGAGSTGTTSGGAGRPHPLRLSRARLPKNRVAGLGGVPPRFGHGGAERRPAPGVGPRAAGQHPELPAGTCHAGSIAATGATPRRRWAPVRCRPAPTPRRYRLRTLAEACGPSGGQWPEKSPQAMDATGGWLAIAWGRSSCPVCRAPAAPRPGAAGEREPRRAGVRGTAASAPGACNAAAGGSFTPRAAETVRRIRPDSAAGARAGLPPPTGGRRRSSGSHASNVRPRAWRPGAGCSHAG